MLENGQMTDFAEQFDQLILTKLSLKLNVIEATQFFRQKMAVNKIKLCIKGTNGI